MSRKQPEQLDLFKWELNKTANEKITEYLIGQKYRGENVNERQTSNKLRAEVSSNSKPRLIQKQNNTTAKGRKIMEIIEKYYGDKGDIMTCQDQKEF